MKKAIAMLLAVSASMSMGVSVFADSLQNDEQDLVVISSSDAEDTSSSSSQDEMVENNSSSDAEDNSSSEGSSSEESTPASDPSALVFKADANGAVLGDTLLEPGKEYKFPVYLMIDEKEVALNSAHLEDYKFTYSKISSTGVQNFKIEEEKGVYYLVVEIKETTPVKAVDVKYNVKLVRKSNNLSVFAQEVKFSYGYEESSGDYISGLDKGDVIEIDNARPVITADQFEKIAEINDYRNVTLSGNGWRFTVNVTDESSKNMVFSNSGIKEIMAKFPEQDFKFFKFAGKPTFTATGRVELDVEDIMDEFDNMYVYRYTGGKLYRISASLDEEENMLSFRTNTLDTFLVTNKQIKDGTVVTENTGSSDAETNSPSEDTDKNNPTTGASDMIHAAVMAAIGMLGAAGAVTAKKLGK